MKVYNILNKCILATLTIVVFGIYGRAQGISVRNNLLWDLTGSPNLGIEIPLSEHWSIGANGELKTWPRFFPWDKGTKDDARQWKYFTVVPEVRYYPESVYNGWFFGGDLIYSHYNASKIHLPLGLFKDLKDKRHQGDFYGAGLFAGRSWWISDHFRIEAEAGIGAGYRKAKEFECQHCGDELGTVKGLQLVPKLGLNIAWNPVARKKAKKEITELINQIEDSQPPVQRVRTPEIIVQKPVERQLTAVEELAKNHPLLHPAGEYVPYSKGTVVRKMPGALYVFYEQGRAEVKRSITTLSGPRDNGPVIDEILSITEQILADEASSIAKIQIVGLASFEGDRWRNASLSLDRAHALKNFVQQHFNIPNEKFEVVGGGEAWTDLRDQLNDLLLAGGGADLTVEELKTAIEIIDTEKDIDVRERKFKAAAGGKIYEKMHRGLFADQRSAGYLRIYYDIKEK